MVGTLINERQRGVHRFWTSIAISCTYLGVVKAVQPDFELDSLVEMVSANGDIDRIFPVHLPFSVWRETLGFAPVLQLQTQDARLQVPRGADHRHPASQASSQSRLVGTWPPKRKVHGRPRALLLKDPGHGGLTCSGDD
ncbi:hypothetical protein EsH8_I_000314 [Colletotrichum jinshuiense]